MTLPVPPADAELRHLENMSVTRWIAEKKDELFIAQKDRVSDGIKEAAWKQIMNQCLRDGHIWAAGRDWSYLRDNKWTMIKGAVRRHLAGNGPQRYPMKDWADELTNFMLEHDLIDPMRDYEEPSAKRKRSDATTTQLADFMKMSKPSGGRITIKAETDITEQFRNPMFPEESSTDPEPPAMITLSEALSAVQNMPEPQEQARNSSADHELLELQKQALRAAIKRDEALADAARQVQKYYEKKVLTNGS